jgi:hypothetical protein
MVVADIERNDISYISETLDLLPVAHVVTVSKMRVTISHDKRCWKIAKRR